jgi:hypothetical protein
MNAPITYFTENHAASMTLRDYFAGQALVGLLANPKLEKAILEKQDWIERTVWLWADAVIDRRHKDNR